MGISPEDIRYRDLRASEKVGVVLGHAAVELVGAEFRRVHNGWLYWGAESFIFFTYEPIFNGSRELALDYDFVKSLIQIDRPVYGVLKFETNNQSLAFHSTREQTKLIEKAIRDHFNRK